MLRRQNNGDRKKEEADDVGIYKLSPEQWEFAVSETIFMPFLLAIAVDPTEDVSEVISGLSWKTEVPVSSWNANLISEL